MTEFRFARPGEEEEILDLINAVFSQAARPHDFAGLLPKVYARPGFSQFHAVAVEAGRIRGTVALLPLAVKMGKAPPLRGGYIGSVAVHPRFQGRGYMRELMAMQADWAQEKEYDFLALGGQRQRYQYHGFESACLGFEFTATAANVRHAFPDAPPVRLEPLKRDHPDMDALFALYAAQASFCVRTKELFYDTLRSYNGAPWLIRDGTGRPAGYLIALNDGITELTLAEESLLPAVLRTWLTNRRSCRVACPGWHIERAAALSAFAEECRAGNTQMLRVLNWERVLGAALSFRRSIAPLPEGRRVLRVEGAGTWALEVTAAEARAVPAEDAPNLCLSPRQAAALLFSPFSLLTVRDSLLRCWLPLPLDIPVADQF